MAFLGLNKPVIFSGVLDVLPLVTLSLDVGFRVIGGGSYATKILVRIFAAVVVTIDAGARVWDASLRAPF